MFSTIKMYAVHVGLFMMGAFALVFDNGYAVGPLWLMLLSFTAYWDISKSSIERSDVIFISALLLYFTVGLFDTLVHGQELSNLDLFSRYLLAGWLAFYLSRFKLNSTYLWYGYAAGAIYAGGYAIYASLFLSMKRVEGAGLNAIHFGNLSMMLAVLCLAGILWANQQRYRKSMIALMLFAAFMGVVASLLSGTRSGWIGFPFVIVALYIFYADHFPKNYVRTGLLVALGLLLMVVMMPQTNVLNRVKAAASDIQNYIDGNAKTSVGLRFEMWRTGYHAFLEKPIIGFGEEAFYEYQKRVVEEHGIHKNVLTFNHLHNQYVEELAKRGLLGFIALLLLFFIPLKMFSKRLRSSDEVRALAAAGFVVVICMVDFCLTQAMLRITSGATFFAFNLVVIWAVMRSSERRPSKQLQWELKNENLV